MLKYPQFQPAKNTELLGCLLFIQLVTAVFALVNAAQFKV